MPRITSTAPGISVPMSRPLDASFAMPPVPPRAERNTPAQKTMTMIAPVYTPLLARSGLKM